MGKYVYRIMFDNGNAMSFEYDKDIDLHKICVGVGGGGSIVFDDIFINLQHVVYIEKEPGG